MDEIEKVKSKAFEIVQNGKWWWIGISDASVEGTVYILGQYSVRPKPPFRFRPNTETETENWP